MNEPQEDLFQKLGVPRPVVQGLPQTSPAVASPGVAPATKPQEDLFAKFGLERPEASDRESILANSQDMKAVRNMMVASKGTDYQSKPDEEVFDDFLSHMRWMGTNEVYTIKEAMDVYGSDDKTKAAYGEAYKVYDKVGSIFSTGDVGDKASAVKDYAAAIITSPSTWAGFIVGRAASRVVSKAAQRKLIGSAVAAAGKQAAAKGASKAVQLSAKREVANAAIKVNAKIAVASALGIEAPVASLQDRLYQDIMLETEAQDEFSGMQNAVATILGGSGAVFSLLGNKTFKGASGLKDVDLKIVKGRKARAAKAGKVVAKEAADAIKRANADWMKLAEEGKGLDANVKLRESVMNWFTDYKTDDGFISILQKAGADLDVKTSGSFSKSLVDFAEGLDDEAKDALSEAFKPLGVSFGQVVATFAATTRQAGQNNNLLSSAAKFWDNFKDITVSNKAAAEGLVQELDEASKADKALDKNSIGYIQSVWKRMIVSHPGTTMLNVKGWGFAMAGRTMAETLQMSALYGAGGVKTLMGDASAKISLGRAKALKDNMLYMTRMAVDPFTTVEGFYKLLEKAPTKIKGKVTQQFFQGVDTRGAASFGLDPTKAGTKATEAAIEVAQRLSLVNAQDVMTKSFSGIKELDKQIRIKHGIGLEELLNTNRAYEISDEMWERAVKVLQEDTFSVDYRGGKGLVGSLAKISQELSAAPGVGFIYPFGQFVNSVIAFGYRYSPLGMVDAASKAYKNPGMDIGEKVAQGMVGTAAWALAWNREREKEADGLQWFEERDSTGAVYKVDNLFPVGLYNVIGRIAHKWDQGGGVAPKDVPKDLWIALGQQLSAPAAIAELGKFAPVIDLVNFMTDPATPEDDKKSYMSVLGYALEAVSGVASGFTRPLDPLNDMIGIAGDMKGNIDFVNIDRKQAEGVDKAIQGLTRYTDAIFSTLIGEEQPNGRKLYGAPKQSATQRGPVESGNAPAAITGTQYQQRRTPIDRLLGLVNKAPFKVDSFTTGVPQYDAWMNEKITPLLEREAVQLLKNKNFLAAGASVKTDLVESMIQRVRTEVLADLEVASPSNKRPALLNARRNLLAAPRASRARAKAALGITTPDNKLNLLQIEMIKERMAMEKEYFKSEFE